MLWTWYVLKELWLSKVDSVLTDSVDRVFVWLVVSDVLGCCVVVRLTLFRWCKCRGNGNNFDACWMTWDMKDCLDLQAFKPSHDDSWSVGWIGLICRMTHLMVWKDLLSCNLGNLIIWIFSKGIWVDCDILNVSSSKCVKTKEMKESDRSLLLYLFPSTINVSFLSVDT